MATSTPIQDRPRLTLKPFRSQPAPDAPPAPTPTPIKHQQRPRRPSAARVEIDRRVNVTIAILRERFPAAFPPAGDPPLPLAIGITEKITAAAIGLDLHDVINAISFFCNQPEYHTAVIEQTDRVDLAGNVVGFVSVRAKAHAARRLAVLS